MDARLCIGNYGALPYYFEGLDLRVYCVEELCYALKENAFLLDTDIMADRLVDWVRQECGLSELAVQLHDMVHKKGSFSAFVACILRYTGFYDEDTVQRAVQTLKQGAGLSRMEKRKKRIDSLVEQKRYVAAVREYDVLLEHFREAADQEAMPVAGLCASMLHNKGVALAGLMRYGEAAQSFLAAYEADSEEESLKCFLAAKRMELKDNDYVAFAASDPRYADTVLALEKEVEQRNEQWEQEPDCLRLIERERLREEELESYLEDNRRMMQALKESYRSMAG